MREQNLRTEDVSSRESERHFLSDARHDLVPINTKQHSEVHCLQLIPIISFLLG